MAEINNEAREPSKAVRIFEATTAVIANLATVAAGIVLVGVAHRIDTAPAPKRSQVAEGQATIIRSVEGMIALQQAAAVVDFIQDHASSRS